MEEYIDEIPRFDFRKLKPNDLVRIQKYAVQTDAMFEEKDKAITEIIVRLKNYDVSDQDIMLMANLSKEEFDSLYPPKKDEDANY